MTFDPSMIEVAAFPALVRRPRDKVTSPLGALWLQPLEMVKTQRGTGAGLCWGSSCNMSVRPRLQYMLATQVKLKWDLVATMHNLQGKHLLLKPE